MSVGDVGDADADVGRLGSVGVGVEGGGRWWQRWRQMKAGPINESQVVD